jgi:ABC-type polysaccharide/polyol phosphate export permease
LINITMDQGIKRKLSLSVYLARMEFERRFAGSIGGKLWVFAGPFLTIAVIWAALDFGLGLRGSVGPDYGMALAVGLCCWLFFAEAINTSLGSITSQPHLVKKVVFPVILLPVANILVAFAVHLVILAFVILALLAQGKTPGLGALALPFWIGCLFVLTMSVALLVAALNVLLRDTAALVPNLISFLFWVTPIVWPASRLTGDWSLLALLNPASVIIEGYRSALLGTPPLLSIQGTMIFAMFMAAFGVASLIFFRKLRLMFADVM